MTHSEKFAEVKAFYDAGTWSIDRVWNAAGRWITEGEYTEITGFVYPDKG